MRKLSAALLTTAIIFLSPGLSCYRALAATFNGKSPIGQAPKETIPNFNISPLSPSDPFPQENVPVQATTPGAGLEDVTAPIPPSEPSAALPAASNVEPAQTPIPVEKTIPPANVVPPGDSGSAAPTALPPEQPAAPGPAGNPLTQPAATHLENAREQFQPLTDPTAAGADAGETVFDGGASNPPTAASAVPAAPLAGRGEPSLLSPSNPAVRSEEGPLPPQSKYIVLTELAERFGYYGLRGILFIFMVNYVNVSEHDAETYFHLFAGAGYLFTLLGAYLADHVWGKYRTIMRLSLFYGLGEGVLALWGQSPIALFLGLLMVALGMGGVKSSVTAYMGDQLTEENRHLLPKAMRIFYGAINIGSLFSSFLIPLVLVKYGPLLAFGIPGILMTASMFIFWLGGKRHEYITSSIMHGPGFFSIFWYALKHQNKKSPDQGFFDVALEKYPQSDVEAAKAVAGISEIFLVVSFFWALYEQQSTSWVGQAERMNLNLLGVLELTSSQLQVLNPLLILGLIPIYPFLYRGIERLGIKLTPLREMGIGMLLAALSFVAVGIIQLFVDAGHSLSVAWQFIPYLIISLAEIMLSITGLEFAYSQAPPSMKSTIMSFWFLTMFAGNFLTAFMTKMNVFQGAPFFFFFAALMTVVSAVFAWIASKYQPHEYFEKPH